MSNGLNIQSLGKLIQMTTVQKPDSDARYCQGRMTDAATWNEILAYYYLDTEL